MRLIYSVIDRAGRLCYHTDNDPVNIEWELLHLGRLHRLMVDVGEQDLEVVSLDPVTRRPWVRTESGITLVH